MITRISFGAYTLDFAREILPAPVLRSWVKPTPLFSRIAIFQRHGATVDQIRALQHAWKAWKL